MFAVQNQVKAGIEQYYSGDALQTGKSYLKSYCEYTLPSRKRQRPDKTISENKETSVYVI